MGDHQTNMVYFDSVRIPRSRLVGELHQGWRYITEALDYERLQGLSYTGLLRDLDELVAWARSDPERWADPAIRRAVARAAVRTESVRSHMLDGQERLMRGEVPTVEATMLKLAATETRQDLADEMLSLLGPRGLQRHEHADAPMRGRFETNWREEIICTIAGGANEIQRNILATRHLGLPSGR
jgi:hypothetical protein